MRLGVFSDQILQGVCFMPPRKPMAAQLPKPPERCLYSASNARSVEEKGGYCSTGNRRC